jgi:hypothetical protein
MHSSARAAIVSILFLDGVAMNVARYSANVEDPYVGYRGKRLEKDGNEELIEKRRIAREIRAEKISVTQKRNADV